MVSRRAILTSLGLIGLGAAVARVPGLRRAYAQAGVAFPPRWNGEPLARIAQAYQPARAEPNTTSEVVAEFTRDDVVRVRRVVEGEWVFANSNLWLETKYGYLYASLVQPMHAHLPAPPQANLGDGRWAQLIVPYSDTYKTPGPSGHAEDFKGRVHYGSIFRVVELVTGSDGRSWYRVREMYRQIYIRATHLRLIPDEDLAPISPHVPPEYKTIDVNLTDQTLVAYEYGVPVWGHTISSGVRDHPTPEGIHYIWDKRISEHMVADTASDDPDYYDLPGVPFVCYFTDDWVATHGTYWHNDYGRPRSHGCVNLPPDAARWLWRWTTPRGSLTEFYTRSENRLEGTKVSVHY